MRVVGRSVVIGAVLGAAAGVGWILLSVVLLSVRSIASGDPSFGDELRFLPGTVALFCIFAAPIGAVVGVVSGGFAGTADRLLASRLRRLRWTPALGGALLSVVPCWVAYVGFGAADSDPTGPLVTAAIAVVTAVYLFAFAAFSACRHGVGRWPSHRFAA